MKKHLRQCVIYLAVMPAIGWMSTGCNSQGSAAGSNGFNERGGAGNIFYKLEHKDTVRVAYLGGSITAQPGWRVYSRAWFEEEYPGTKIIEINAAIGGTGSPFGVYRLQEHVLQYNPDLVFVEFAVNDAQTDEEKITQSMEGIVRRILEQDSTTDICFIYTIKEEFIDIYHRDSLPASVTAMEKIADRYQIPSINFGPEVVRRVDAGQVLFRGDKSENTRIEIFSADGVHPYVDSGHKIYNEVFMSAFRQMQLRVPKGIASRKINEALTPNLLDKAKMVNWTAVNSGDALELIRIQDDSTFHAFSRYFGSIGKGEPGDSVSFQFRGNALGFYDVVGPGAGTILVTIDGEEHTYRRFDKYCTYWRISYKIIDGLADAVHTVSFKVLDKPIDKREILSGNNKVMNDEKDYTDLNWYLAKVLLDGDLVQDK